MQKAHLPRNYILSGTCMCPHVQDDKMQLWLRVFYLMAFRFLLYSQRPFAPNIGINYYFPHPHSLPHASVNVIYWILLGNFPTYPPTTPTYALENVTYWILMGEELRDLKLRV